MKARLIMVGPPGAGKGTQAATLTESMGIPSISTGAIFRSQMKLQTDLGKRAQEFINTGNLVPDEITDAMVRARLFEEDASEGFLLDGYPRNQHQVEALDAILEDLGHPVDAVINLIIPDDEIVGRLLKRAAIEGREDDNETVIRHRISVYHEQTEPVVKAYRERGKVLDIDGMGSIDEVYSRIVQALESLLNA